MRFVKILITFAVGFALAWVMVVTFGQSEFQARVPARVFGWISPAIPVYLYIVGAGVLGLLVGLLVSLWTYLSMASQIRSRKRTIRDLEDSADSLKRTIAELSQDQPAVAGARLPATKRDLPSVE
jgi:hypothetical protein